MLSEAFSPAILVLAAGQSLRFNGIKVIQPVTKSPMFIETLERLPPLPTFVATGAHHDEITQSYFDSGATLNVTWLQCATAVQGLGHTIAESVNRLRQNQSITHLLIVLADQVAITPQDFETLLELAKTQRNRLVCSEFDDQLSVPAIFPRAYFDSLCQLNGDKGAKAILQQNKTDLISLKLDHARVDIDTRDELHAWQQRLTKQPLSETT